MNYQNNLYQYESIYWHRDLLVVGIDEAGRGPIAGPLVVAAVVFPKNYHNEWINDSKKISEKKRKQLFHQIIKDAIFYRILVVSTTIIDQINIYQATKQAMHKLAIEAPTSVVLTDAMPLECEKETEAIVKGDTKSISIAAASILAKVYRDQLMCAIDYHYPDYLLAKHKGYPTSKHVALLKEFGVRHFYRRTFEPVLSLIRDN